MALCALAAVHANPMWVVRVEGADDTDDAATRSDLDTIARTCASAIDGLPVDVDGIPL